MRSKERAYITTTTNHRCRRRRLVSLSFNFAHSFIQVAYTQKEQGLTCSLLVSLPISPIFFPFLLPFQSISFDSFLLLIVYQNGSCLACSPRERAVISYPRSVFFSVSFHSWVVIPLDPLSSSVPFSLVFSLI